MRRGMGDRVDSPHEEGPELPNLTPRDIIIAVMGITGCGKTTFVNLFSDRKLEVGHGLDSCTVSVQVVPCTLEDGTKIYLVDTPGFDDTYRTDSEILQEVALWLNKAYESKINLAGIIFLQRISDVRVGGSGIQNIKRFQKLCGDKTLGSVVLATTMWSLTSEQAAQDREKELKSQPQLWKRMIDNGSKVFRHDKDKASGLKILKYLIARRRPVALDISREMVDEHRKLADTGAGSELASTVETLIKRLEDKIKEADKYIREARTKSNREDQEIFEAEKQQHEERLANSRKQMLDLQVNAHELVEDMKRRMEANDAMVRENMKRQIEENNATAKESMKRIREDHVLEMEKQRVQMQKQLRHRYLQQMSENPCVVM